MDRVLTLDLVKEPTVEVVEEEHLPQFTVSVVLGPKDTTEVLQLGMTTRQVMLPAVVEEDLELSVATLLSESVEPVARD